MITIILFTIYMYGLGWSLTRFLKKNDLETMVIRMGIGLGALPVLGILLNLLHIPLDWRIILALSISGPFIALGTSRRRLHFKPPALGMPRSHGLALLLILAFCLFIYCRGPFNYPWLENDDSWSHAAGIKYIAIERNLNVPSGEFHYINPYPPGYDLVMGVLHQTDSSLYWTLKFFNGLIIVLGIALFYFFARQFSKNDQTALLGTAALAMIPCYLSHFIWAHSLVVTLFFPALYALHRCPKDRRWIIPAGTTIAGILVTQPTQAVKFLILVLLMYLAWIVVKKKLVKEIAVAVLLGGLISLIWWGPVFNEMRRDESQIAVRGGEEADQVSRHTVSTGPAVAGLFDPKMGTATRSYHFNDYWVLRPWNMINNPIGIGPVLCLMGILGLGCFLKNCKKGGPERRVYHLTILLWTAFTFLGMNSQTFNLPVGLFAFRFWMLFAVPVSILAAEGTLCVLNIMKNRSRRMITITVLVLGALLGSAYPKFRVNTSIWPWGIYWTSYDEIKGYVWMRHHLPVNSRVFAFTDNLFVIGHDMRAEYWREGYQRDFQDAFGFGINELSQRLNIHGFEYMVIGGREIKRFGEKAVLRKVAALQRDGRFKLVHEQDKGAWVFQVLKDAGRSGL